ncbi:asparagine synthase (glutamine-hydrolyzing) [Bradyrhizobium sp. Pha-3]|uniref:asparagine synthase (glutamine-hydrolyzing) n=1 Tax=Bradyrhizobium sp. Pha-3 TaxID=208375 RepID=UPI0035D3DB97
MATALFRNMKLAGAMCGIFGWALRGKHRQDYGTLVRLTNLMKHRGPDGAGYWQGDTAGGCHQVSLGHRRLSIIDLEGGAQPMWSADGSIGLVFNGEIYNYVELREELVSLGHAFRTSSDTEVLIEAYRAWGLDSIRRFRGMFAFGLWDARTQQLVLARDPFGKKPLFIAENSGLLFASEIEPLLKFPGMNTRIDPHAVEHYLLNRYVPGPRTFFQAVRKLSPGCHLVWREGRTNITRYFVPPLASAEPDITDFGEAVRMFKATFDDAVRIRMRSDVAFGAYLSGGIDSSAVVAAMVRHSSERVRTFSVGFREAGYSELDHARTIARQFDTNHEEIVLEPHDFLKSWPTAVLRRGAPAAEPADIPVMMLSHMAASKVKMVLTGEGADELLGGYPKHRAELWIELYQRLVPQTIHDRIISPAMRALPYDMRRAKIVTTAAGERDWPSRMQLWFGGVSLNERDRIIGRPLPVTPPDPHPFSMAVGSNVRRTLFFDQTSWLPDNLLERADRMMMAGSIEGRMPFMDTSLAKLVARFPDNFLVGRSGGKSVLRAAMQHTLPPGTLTRKKIGFRVPIEEWFRGPHREFISDLLVCDGTRVASFCDREVLRQLVNEHLARRQNHEKVLWSLANLELFLRAFKPSSLDTLARHSVPEPL